MKRLFLALPLLLAGCAGPTDAWLNPGVAATQAERALLACEAEARRDFPVAIQTQWTTAVTVGGRVCDDPFCFGVARGIPRARERDVNADLRARAVDLCMREAGYQKVRLPQCPAEIEPLRLAQHPARLDGICLAGEDFALAP